MIFCLRPGELITLGETLYCNVFYKLFLCSFIYMYSAFPFSSLVFSIFIKCKRRDIFFSLQSLQKLESIGKLELLSFFIFKAKFSKLKRMTAS